MKNKPLIKYMLRSLPWVADHHLYPGLSLDSNTFFFFFFFSTTLFLCEGLLVYLEEPTLTGLLSGLASAAAPGSTLAASLAVHAQGRATAEVVAAANARRRAAATEPWRTILPRDEQIALLGRAGWRVDRELDPADLAGGAPAGRTLLVQAGLA